MTRTNIHTNKQQKTTRSICTQPSLTENSVEAEMEEMIGVDVQPFLRENSVEAEMEGGSK